jgi:hypothetical protein
MREEAMYPLAPVTANVFVIFFDWLKLREKNQIYGSTFSNKDY